MLLRILPLRQGVTRVIRGHVGRSIRPTFVNNVGRLFRHLLITGYEISSGVISHVMLIVKHYNRGQTRMRSICARVLRVIRIVGGSLRVATGGIHQYQVNAPPEGDTVQVVDLITVYRPFQRGLVPGDFPSPFKHFSTISFVGVERPRAK